MIGTVSKVVAGCFALAAFAVAIVAGIAGDNAASSILLRALMAMILCYPVGLIAGMICERVVAERVRAHQRENPLHAEDVPGDAQSKPRQRDEEMIAA